MTYYIQLFRLIFNSKDHIPRIREAESVRNLKKTSALLIVFSVLLYAWMGYLGIGSGFISMNATLLSTYAYEESKLMFMMGRAVYGLLFAAFILFVPTVLFYYVTEVPYAKLLIMQQVVLAVLLFERLLWVPLSIFAGLDWYTSVFSLGILASYLTEIDWMIYLFGAISIFQVGLIWFVYRYLRALSDVRGRFLLTIIILLFGTCWALAAIITVTDNNIISGWFA